MTGGVATLLFALPVVAGTLDEPPPPDDAASAMYTLEGLYERLMWGRAGRVRSGGFREPSEMPAPTGHTLNEIMAVAPVPDDLHGAVPADVACGLSFWSLRTDGAWGRQVGTHCALKFSANDDGTVTSRTTGLRVLQHANCFDAQTWDTAMTEVAALADGHCGLTDGSRPGDWRLPARGELRLLFEASDLAFFSDVQAHYYWSSTTREENTEEAWSLSIVDGFVDHFGKDGLYFVWPIRSAD